VTGLDDRSAIRSAAANQVISIAHHSGLREAAIRSEHLNLKEQAERRLVVYRSTSLLRRFVP
jgi:hypothetical protein